MGEGKRGGERKVVNAGGRERNIAVSLFVESVVIATRIFTA
jgi:hypothetical protein